MRQMWEQGDDREVDGVLCGHGRVSVPPAPAAAGEVRSAVAAEVSGWDRRPAVRACHQWCAFKRPSASLHCATSCTGPAIRTAVFHPPPLM